MHFSKILFFKLLLKKEYFFQNFDMFYIELVSVEYLLKNHYSPFGNVQLLFEKKK